jgi:LytS/YehU family sensor histidine kinase
LRLIEDIEAVDDPDYMIAPMLLIIFVENAFKHARNTSDESIMIDMGVKFWGDSILFSIRNSFGAAKKEVKTNNGLGLVNTKKRLELLYPGQYDLKISEDGKIYSVMLRLNIKRNVSKDFLRDSG